MRPPSAEEALASQRQFAMRQGLDNVGLAIDGTHVPWQPSDAEWAEEFHNYKGWYSVLCVAIVNSFYMFVDAEVGHPGRSGDNTVTKASCFMAAIKKDPVKWLGPNGFIVSDGAFSQDDIVMTPYPLGEGMTMRKRYFNFCFSSTRIFVEQVFGIWKMRWRVLLKEIDVKKRCYVSSIIMATMVLHNICCVYGLGEYEAHRGDDTDAIDVVKDFMSKYDHSRCRTCASKGTFHCVHVNRAVHSSRQTEMSKRRDELCDKVWQDYYNDNGRYPTLPACY
jgi:hypothetical protein